MDALQVYDKSKEISFGDVLRETEKDYMILLSQKIHKDRVMFFSAIRIKETFIHNHQLIELIEINRESGYTVITLNEQEFYKRKFRRVDIYPYKNNKGD